MPKVSILTINYNGEGITIECLKSLEKQTFNDFEIIIVDNASTDGSANSITNYLKRSGLAPLAHIISAGRNMGFAGGNIEGLKYANGEYIALLNNDTEADPDWLKELVMAIEQYPEAGICASKMIAYGKNVIDSAGDGYSTLLKGFKMGEGEAIECFDRETYVFGACAGAALYRRKMLEEIGFLDEDFFLIHEDTDLNFRAQLAGWKVLFVPSAVVNHKVRSSIGNMSDQAIYYTLRNSEFVRIKNVPLGIFIKCLPEFILGTITEFYYFAVKHKRFGLYCKAKADALKKLPELLKKRSLIAENRKVSSRYIYSMMTYAFQKDYFNAKIKKFFQ